MDKMTITEPLINHRTVHTHLFHAFLGMEVIRVYAISNQVAKQLAIEYFRPKKSERASIIIKSC